MVGSAAVSLELRAPRLAACSFSTDGLSAEVEDDDDDDGGDDDARVASSTRKGGRKGRGRSKHPLAAAAAAERFDGGGWCALGGVGRSCTAATATASSFSGGGGGSVRSSLASGRVHYHDGAAPPSLEVPGQFCGPLDFNLPTACGSTLTTHASPAAHAHVLRFRSDAGGGHGGHGSSSSSSSSSSGGGGSQHGAISRGGAVGLAQPRLTLLGDDGGTYTFALQVRRRLLLLLLLLMWWRWNCPLARGDWLASCKLASAFSTLRLLAYSLTRSLATHSLTPLTSTFALTCFGGCCLLWLLLLWPA